MRTSSIPTILALVLGGGAALSGLLLMAAYVWEAVIQRLGEGDQSLLFWYSPFLMAGLMLAILGGAGFYWGVLRLKEGHA